MANFTLARIQDLESEIDEQKIINLQFQSHIRIVSSRNRNFKAENTILKDANAILTNKVNRYERSIENRKR